MIDSATRNISDRLNWICLHVGHFGTESLKKSSIACSIGHPQRRAGTALATHEWQRARLLRGWHRPPRTRLPDYAGDCHGDFKPSGSGRTLPAKPLLVGLILAG